MWNSILFLAFFSFLIACNSPVKTAETKRLEKLASQVSIIRDSWGIPHIYGKTDADVVFGCMYAQCEDNFERLERNYLEVFGRMAEIEGEGYLYQDLEMKIMYDSSAAIADYKNASPWLKKLLNAFADGINYYLNKHPEVTALAIKKFEPWYPLMFTDGAYISTNTGGLKIEDLHNMFGSNKLMATTKLIAENKDAAGSNGFAIAPSKTASGHALLYINPHVSFYFRTEMHLVSEEGLNVYGAVTWGQFFIFQGFNEHCGWMHTSSMADAADLYEEKIIKKENGYAYEYEGEQKTVTEKTIAIAVKKDDNIITDSVKIYYTHHGPVLGIRNGKWLSLKEQNRSMSSLIQSWQRMKVMGLNDFKKMMALKANSSTNTLYADDKGNIAYWHGNFVPRRDSSFDWSKPVPGNIVATEWKGFYEPDELVKIENPAHGYLQNCNSTPFSVAGYNNIDKKNYRSFMAPETENFRSVTAIKELEREKNFTADKLISVGYNHYLSLFDSLLPSLINAFDSLPAFNPFRTALLEPVNLLRNWDKKSSATSEATTLAIIWANQLISSDTSAETNDQLKLIKSVVTNSSSKQKLEILQAVINGLQRMFGTWKIAWGEINRYQRTSGNFHSSYDDKEKSMPVGFASAFYGSLPAFETVWQNTKKQYGAAGNSFIAVVEFGKKIKARSIVAGGQSFNPMSKHFNDQAQRFMDGNLKTVFFYKEDVVKNAEKTYHPGAEK